ncbi:MAG: outer membrane protein assembly factor BamA [Phycisphaeraceae bacterium]|nr:outer membrane protein assembly factor BamA [Phycisphaeraceae bacterium]
MTHISPRSALRIALLVLAACWMTLLPARAQTYLEFTGRPVAEVNVQGLRQVSQILVRNQIRVQPGDAFDPQIVDNDIIRIEHLGKFAGVRAQVQQRTDGSLVLTYVVDEQPLITDLQVVGNKHISDSKLLDESLLKIGDPVDRFLIDQAVAKIKSAYANEGYFLTEVEVDRQLLDEQGILIFKIREGPHVRIRAIRYEGNHAFSGRQLSSQVRSKSLIPLLFWRKTDLNRDQLELDVAGVREFYQDRGYLDAQVGRRVELSPNQKDAVVVFLVEEGPKYTVGQVRITGNGVFNTEQIALAIPLKSGDVYSRKGALASQEAVLNLYGKIGYIETTAGVARLFHETEPVVDLDISLDEGQPYVVGIIEIRGNRVTRDKVVLRDLRGLTPARRFDRQMMEKTKQRLSESPFFSKSRITVLGDPSQTTRDVLVEVEEASTGSVGLGMGVSSDLGIFGSITLTQRNFDIAAPGNFFRGAGQFFSLNLNPGVDNSQYGFSFREPSFLDTDNFFDIRAYITQRDRLDWSEGRLGATVGPGRNFSDTWSGAVQARAEAVDIYDLDTGVVVPQDVLDVQGSNFIASIGPSVTRSTTDSRVFPTEGSELTLALQRAGLLGDFDFTTVSVDYYKFWTVEEDYLSRKSVLTFRSNIAYIIEQDAPTFERLYAGGRNFRGFDYRGVGPRGIGPTPASIVTSRAVGGNWLFLAGLEYNVPVYEDMVRWVVFIDTGTVQTDIGFDEYRVAIGTGLRLRVPFFNQKGPPIALDFGFPVLKQDGDQSRLISFDIALPFQ